MNTVPATSIYEAACATDGSGAVRRGLPLTQVEAIAHRQTGQDVVVCGEDTIANRDEANAIESAVGPCKHDGPHRFVSGPMALPHWQQQQPPPGGHSFYETQSHKAIP